MIFLPIVERELRVASRKRNTFWTRVAAATVAVAIASGLFILASVFPFGLGTNTLGKTLFALLTWLSLGMALSAGLFFTADCLSEEKRDGTLGLLFLTDLRGYDVVFGKLLATSLRGACALVAVFPILAATLLLGGVTGTQLWKASLALVNALFLSLVAGLFVSAISHDSQKAMSGTLALLVLLAGLGPAFDAAYSSGAFQPILSLSSPAFLFSQTDGWGRTMFWPALLINQIVGWTLFGITCRLLPRTWQEKSRKSSLARSSREKWRFGGATRRVTLRRKLLGVNPVLWLVCRERWQATVLWLLALLGAGALAGLVAADDMEPWMVWSFFGRALVWVVFLGIASQAGRFFVEARRSGLTELLLVTPLTVKEIVQGQWRGLLRMFGLPLMLLVAAQVAGEVWAQKNTMTQMAAANLRAASGTNAATNATVTTNVFGASRTVTVTATVRSPTASPPIGLTVAVISVAGVVTTLGSLIALSWFGMWMGMNSKNASFATLKTIVFVQIVPWFVVSFASVLMVTLVLMPKLMKGAAATGSFFGIWYPVLTTAISTALYLAKNIGFSIWARRKLSSEFRPTATRIMAPVSLAVPPPLASPP